VTVPKAKYYFAFIKRQLTVKIKSTLFVHLLLHIISALFFLSRWLVYSSIGSLIMMSLNQHLDYWWSCSYSL